jgi:Na+/H+ antiporter NhaD/arsenite permease-like protein
MVTELILLFTLIAIAIGYIPRFRMNRTTIALVGATALMVTGGIKYDAALKAINLDTIILLFSMMIINANFSVSGFFGLVSQKIIKYANTPKKLLFIIIFTSGLLASILLNDTVSIMFTPIVIMVLINLKRDPIPYLLGLGMAANIGSAMTPVGNPQNMLIASYSGITFLNFVSPLLFVSIVSLYLLYFLIQIFFKNEFSDENIDQIEISSVRIYKPLLIKSTVATLIMISLFLFHFSVSYAALIAASILLFTRRIKPERVFKEIDWSLLVFFSALFVVTATVETTGIGEKLYTVFKNFIFVNIFSFSFAMMIFSNIVSNVPAVMLFSPFLKTLNNGYEFWIAAAMSSTFAGNLTIIGSVANIIVVEIAAKNGIKISFMQFFKVGILVTILTTLIGSLWLMFIFYR